MLPSWRDRVSVFFGPANLHFARYGKGLRPEAGMRLSVACEEVDGTSWQPVLEALGRTLATLQWKDADVKVTVSNEFVRYALVAEAGKLRGEAERAAAARHQLRAVYGGRADGWRVALGAGSDGDAIAAGIEAELVDGIVATLVAVNLRPISVEPFMAVAFNLCRASIGRESAWLAVAESGRLCLAHFDRGAWHRLRSQRLRGRLEDELPAALERSRLTDGVETGAGRVLLVSQEEPQVEFPRGDGWSIERVRMEGIGVPALATEH